MVVHIPYKNIPEWIQNESKYLESIRETGDLKADTEVLIGLELSKSDVEIDFVCLATREVLFETDIHNDLLVKCLMIINFLDTSEFIELHRKHLYLKGDSKQWLNGYKSNIVTEQEFTNYINTNLIDQELAKLGFICRTTKPKQYCDFIRFCPEEYIYQHACRCLKSGGQAIKAAVMYNGKNSVRRYAWISSFFNIPPELAHFTVAFEADNLELWLKFLPSIIKGKSELIKYEDIVKKPKFIKGMLELEFSEDVINELTSASISEPDAFQIIVEKGQLTVSGKNFNLEINNYEFSRDLETIIMVFDKSTNNKFKSILAANISEYWKNISSELSDE